MPRNHLMQPPHQRPHRQRFSSSTSSSTRILTAGQWNLAHNSPKLSVAARARGGVARLEEGDECVEESCFLQLSARQRLALQQHIAQSLKRAGVAVGEPRCQRRVPLARGAAAYASAA